MLLPGQQGFTTGEMGFRVSLQRSNPEPLMSALGQKQTLTLVHPMSALPPKSDIRAVVPLALFGGQNSISPVVIDGLHPI
jgi:hypothetical protein